MASFTHNSFPGEDGEKSLDKKAVFFMGEEKCNVEVKRDPENG